MGQAYRITAPTAWSGRIGPVEFVGGVADTDHPQVVAYCTEAGYTVEPVDAGTAVTRQPAPEVATAPVATKAAKATTRRPSRRAH